MEPKVAEPEKHHTEARIGETATPVKEAPAPAVPHPKLPIKLPAIPKNDASPSGGSSIRKLLPTVKPPETNIMHNPQPATTNVRDPFATNKQSSEAEGGISFNPNPNPNAAIGLQNIEVKSPPLPPAPPLAQETDKPPVGQTKMAFSPEVNISEVLRADNPEIRPLTRQRSYGPKLVDNMMMKMPNCVQQAGMIYVCLMYLFGCAIGLALLFIEICRLVVIPIATFRHNEYFMEEIKHTGRLGFAIWIMSLIAVAVGCLSACCVQKEGNQITGSSNGCFQGAIFVMEVIYVITMLTYWDRFKEVTGNSSLFQCYMAYSIISLSVYSIGLLALVCFCCCTFVLGASSRF